MAHVIGAHLPRLIQNLRDAIPQIGFVNHLLDIAQLIGPTAEIRAGDWSLGDSGWTRSRAGRAGISAAARQLIEEIPAAAVVIAALALLSLLLTLLIGSLLT